jgi:DNA-directed RNA polymerase specialized sigma24 family protein
VAQLYERSQRRLRAVASRYVGDEAEDVVQDAFLKAFAAALPFAETRRR